MQSVLLWQSNENKIDWQDLLPSANQNHLNKSIEYSWEMRPSAFELKGPHFPIIAAKGENYYFKAIIITYKNTV